jgi:hypothetical protein
VSKLCFQLLDVSPKEIEFLISQMIASSLAGSHQMLIGTAVILQKRRCRRWFIFDLFNYTFKSLKFIAGEIKHINRVEFFNEFREFLCESQPSRIELTPEGVTTCNCGICCKFGGARTPGSDCGECILIVLKRRA